MPLSTFNSECGRITGATWTLLGLIATLLAGAEVATRFVVAPRSAVLSRIASEREAARKLDNGDVLFVGNSLLLWGVDTTVLNQSLEPHWRTRRFVVESTSFEDWMFGLKSLDSHGSKPSAIFLVLSPKQIIHEGVLGDYFAHQLMDLRDLPEVARRVGLHPTATAGMFVANQSTFYGLRTELRKALLQAVVPGFSSLFTRINLRGTGSAVGSQHDKILARMIRFREFSRSTGGRAVLVVPPLLSGRSEVDEILDLGQSLGVHVISPVPVGEIGPEGFSDGFHLNASGQRVFTQALAAAALRFLEGSDRQLSR